MDGEVCFEVQGESFWSASPDLGTVTGRRSVHQVVGCEDFLEDVLHFVDIEGPEGLGAEVSENAQASDTVSSETNRQQDIDASLSALFNAGEQLFGTDASGNVKYPAFKMKTSNAFQGESDHSRKSRVTAEISATVRAIEPNGILLIEGRRTIYVDSERKNIILTGRVRPEDISPENTVESSVIADAEIVYEGFGPVSDGSRPGIVTRILDLVPLF